MLHLIKLAVGITDIAHLERAQGERAALSGDLSVRRAFTRRKPIRPEVEDGSLYWVIQGLIRCRQKIQGFDAAADAEGRPYCLIRLAPELIPVAATRRGPFQGWRYLTVEAAPPDCGKASDQPPAEMLAELRSLGLL
jgi:hypothetical protein